MTRDSDPGFLRERRRIALIAPPWYPLPPAGYGGIELVVALLARELRRLGHCVTLFGAAGSEPGTVICAPSGWDAELGQPSGVTLELAYLARVFEQLRQVEHVDVVHDHSGHAGLLGSTLLARAPAVHTVHGHLDEPQRAFYSSVGARAGLVAISESQRSTAPELSWVGTVHNAVDVDALRVASRDEKDGFLLCLARICPAKGQSVAIEVARRTGRRLVLAGKVESYEYFRNEVAPHLDGERVRYVPNVAGREKADLLARADALLAPITWAEPFGLSVVEAMASGTPAISFALGAAVELIEEGRTGFVVRDVDAMVAAVSACAELEPMRCASLVRARFDPRAMAGGYMKVYERVIAGADGEELGGRSEDVA